MVCVCVSRVCVNCLCRVHVSGVSASCLYACVVGCLCVLGNLYVFPTLVPSFLTLPARFFSLDLLLLQSPFWR